MQVEELLAQARDTMTVKRVFGEPIERDGITVIPVAKVMGGGGGGSGEGPMSRTIRVGGDAATAGSTAEGASDVPDAGAMGSGSGAGFGVRATPAGAYVIKDGQVRWEPAMDLTRIALMGQVVAIVFLLVVRSVLKSRR
jgi:uncharacterized spore protein YtfJ